MMDILEQAIDEIRDCYCEPGEEQFTFLKSSDGTAPDYVTSVDLAIEAKLKSYLGRKFPHAKFLAEESYRSMDITHAQLTFVIDPVDGTHEFIIGGKDYATSIAVLNYGRLESAALYFPVYGILMLCQKGKGVLINQKSHTNSDRIASLQNVKHGTIGASPRQIDLHVMQALMLEKSLFLKPISAVTPKAAAVVLGQVYGSLSFPMANSTAYIWDYAAAALILKELGLGFYSLAGEDLGEKLPISHPHGWFAGGHKQFAKLFDSKVAAPEISSGSCTSREC